MFTERYRSHHDAEAHLARLLKPAPISGGRPGGPGERPGGGAAGKPMPGDYSGELEERLRGESGAAGAGASGAGVYIHIPYCDRICTFCNLNRKESGGADLEAYTGYLVSEIKTWGAYRYIREGSFSAVYLGGGTPTVLSTRQLETLLKALKDNLPLSGDCEITVESAQHNLGPEKAAALERAGVNRFSLGIQTVSERGRALLGRTLPEEKAREHLRALRENFGGVLGIDIIYSYPGETLAELRQDAELCINSGIDSVSFYSLMIQEGSALARSIADKAVTFERSIESDRAAHRLFYQTLKEAGFSLLELTKLARPGRDRYRYIRVQYGRGDLLPIGSGAGGRIAGFPVYSLAPGRRFVSPGTGPSEKYHRMLGLLEFARYDPALLCGELDPEAGAAVRGALSALAGEGLLEKTEDGGYSPTAEGVFWGNNMAAAILEAAVTASGAKNPADPAEAATQTVQGVGAPAEASHGRR
ncbi:MAG: coproporphyrinogen III oxidase family protein [Spirochaetaceae bacterium]|jgi:oxygen-independent coproporphyrinogen-3 oxidase|nr:coproporphyrinogen III oxidase family protein [Spirochaetaceae bacterium]